MRKILFTVALAAALVGCNNGQMASNGVSFDDVIKTRRSVRSYDATKTISEAEVRELLLSAQEAPSWCKPAAHKILCGTKRRND
ncbi:MAG: nitroreductase family protein [Salinivirgaceae bacterium]|nr:nitroreductase family protein [Salinivirgaceae bacterium]